MACLVITGVMKSTLTAAMEVLFESDSAGSVDHGGGEDVTL
jgi:hypothetical protein